MHKTGNLRNIGNVGRVFSSRGERSLAVAKVQFEPQTETDFLREWTSMHGALRCASSLGDGRNFPGIPQRHRLFSECSSPANVTH